jgi:ABC-type tungstate transport system permease subunit
MIVSKPPIGRHPTAPRRVLTLAAAALLCIFLLPAVAARADTSSSLTVIGTSDVSDSGLMQNVIEPEFHAAYPQFTFKYVGTASGTAITDAETGVNTPSVLIVHAASLENQFVAGGYSFLQYGLAIFRNDFVLAGPNGDPAGVLTNAQNNIVQAFADIAAAGYNGGGTPKVTFVSRGGTPGTTVEEHQIWALVAKLPALPPGLALCVVGAADGGGLTPVSAASGLNGLPCSATGLPPASALPSWYVATGLTQGPNVVAANACAGYASGPGSCYVFTDRGTYDYLDSGLDPAGAVPGLFIFTRNNSASAPGGADELINYFHAYVINPNKCIACGVNLTAAEDFTTFITSPALQSQLKYYLDDTSDPDGAPFIADASPIISEAGIPAKVALGKSITVTGSVTNAEPDYPVLAGKSVSVDEIEAGIPVVVASGHTTATGTYKIKFAPTSSGSYQVATGEIAQIEKSTLTPPFGDLLSPGASAAVRLTVTGIPSSTSVSFTKVKVTKKGAVTVTGTLKPAPTAKGAKVELLALTKSTHGRLKEIGHTSVGKGKTKFTIKAKLARRTTGVIQLEYGQKGKTSVFSKLRTIVVR